MAGGAYPYPLPAAGAPLRVAFVGARDDLESRALSTPTPGIEPALVDVRAVVDSSHLVDALGAAEPHVVVVLCPELVPPESLARVPAATLGLLRASAVVDGFAAHYDRVVGGVVGGGELATRPWMSMAPPVDDRMFAPVRPAGDAPRALFLGSSTARREAFLIRAKHEHDLLHYVHGLTGQPLRDVLGAVDVGINVHADDRPAFEHRVPMHLAAGHLLVSEPLDPPHGLEPGVDFIAVTSSDELLAVLAEMHGRPDRYDAVRVSGRAKAERFRASLVWPPLIEALVADIAADGTARQPS